MYKQIIPIIALSVLIFAPEAKAQLEGRAAGLRECVQQAGGNPTIAIVQSCLQKNAAGKRGCLSDCLTAAVNERAAAGSQEIGTPVRKCLQETCAGAQNE